MFYLYWFIFIIIESYIHKYIIEDLKYDPTPDDQTWWEASPEVAFRILGFIIIWYFTIPISMAIMGVTLIGAMAVHLAFFGPILNKFRNKPLSYLGNGSVDNILKKVPLWIRITLGVSIGAFCHYISQTQFF